MGERIFLDQSLMNLRLNSYNTAEKTMMILENFGLVEKEGFAITLSE
jgi:hypothetical protein